MSCGTTAASRWARTCHPRLYNASVPANHARWQTASLYIPLTATLYFAQVRKKAVMALHRFEQLDPRHDGPLSGADIDGHLRRMLCDKVDLIL